MMIFLCGLLKELECLGQQAFRPEGGSESPFYPAVEGRVSFWR